MNSKQFFYKAKLMREAQIKYFHTRSSASLMEAKKIETEIDDEIARVEALIGSPEQKEIFK